MVLVKNSLLKTKPRQLTEAEGAQMIRRSRELEKQAAEREVDGVTAEPATVDVMDDESSSSSESSTEDDAHDDPDYVEEPSACGDEQGLRGFGNYDRSLGMAFNNRFEDENTNGQERRDRTASSKIKKAERLQELAAMPKEERLTKRLAEEKERLDKLPFHRSSTKKRGPRTWDFKTMHQAVEAYQEIREEHQGKAIPAGKGVRSVAKDFGGLSKSSVWRRTTKGTSATVIGRPCTLSLAEEEQLCDEIKYMASQGWALTWPHVRSSVRYFVKCRRAAWERDDNQEALQLEKRFLNDQPSEKWYRGFLKRHPELKTSRPKYTSTAKAEVTPPMVQSFFENYIGCATGIPPENIMNADETAIHFIPSQGKVILDRNVSSYQFVQNTDSKSNMSLMFTVAANGTLLPPYFIFKAKRIYETWIKEGPPGAGYGVSNKGWMNSEQMVMWLKTVVIPYSNALKNNSLRILLIDNYNAHKDVEFVAVARDHGIRVIFLPRNSTSILQPLDVGFFKSFKDTWGQVVKRRLELFPAERGLQNPVVASLVKAALFKMGQNKCKRLILMAFEKTGLCPIDPARVLKDFERYHHRADEDTSCIWRQGTYKLLRRLLSFQKKTETQAEKDGKQLYFGTENLPEDQDDIELSGEAADEMIGIPVEKRGRQIQFTAGKAVQYEDLLKIVEKNLGKSRKKPTAKPGQGSVSGLESCGHGRGRGCGRGRGRGRGGSHGHGQGQRGSSPSAGARGESSHGSGAHGNDVSSNEEDNDSSDSAPEDDEDEEDQEEEVFVAPPRGSTIGVVPVLMSPGFFLPNTTTTPVKPKTGDTSCDNWEAMNSGDSSDDEVGDDPVRKRLLQQRKMLKSCIKKEQHKGVTSSTSGVMERKPGGSLPVKVERAISRADNQDVTNHLENSSTTDSSKPGPSGLSDAEKRALSLKTTAALPIERLAKKAGKSIQPKAPLNGQAPARSAVQAVPTTRQTRSARCTLASFEGKATRMSMKVKPGSKRKISEARTESVLSSPAVQLNATALNELTTPQEKGLGTRKKQKLHVSVKKLSEEEIEKLSSRPEGGSENLSLLEAAPILDLVTPVSKPSILSPQYFETPAGEGALNSSPPEDLHIPEPFDFGNSPGPGAMLINDVPKQLPAAQEVGSAPIAQIGVNKPGEGPVPKSKYISKPEEGSMPLLSSSGGVHETPAARSLVPASLTGNLEPDEPSTNDSCAMVHNSTDSIGEQMMVSKKPDEPLQEMASSSMNKDVTGQPEEDFMDSQDLVDSQDFPQFTFTVDPRKRCRIDDLPPVGTSEEECDGSITAAQLVSMNGTDPATITVEHAANRPDVVNHTSDEGAPRSADLLGISSADQVAAARSVSGCSAHSSLVAVSNDGMDPFQVKVEVKLEADEARNAVDPQVALLSKLGVAPSKAGQDRPGEQVGRKVPLETKVSRSKWIEQLKVGAGVKCIMKRTTDQKASVSEEWQKRDKQKQLEQEAMLKVKYPVGIRRELIAGRNLTFARPVTPTSDEVLLPLSALSVPDIMGKWPPLLKYHDIKPAHPWDVLKAGDMILVRVPKEPGRMTGYLRLCLIDFIHERVLSVTRNEKEKRFLCTPFVKVGIEPYLVFIKGREDPVIFEKRDVYGTVEVNLLAGDRIIKDSDSLPHEMMK